MSKKNDITRRNVLEAGTVLALGGPMLVGSVSAQASENVTLIDQVLLEMRVTRNFLAAWFAGAIEKPGDPMDFYLQGVLAENFTIVRPNGRRLDRQQTLTGFYDKLYGSDPTVLRHENNNIRPILDTGTLAIVGYDESHVYPDHEIVNALTAVFQRDDAAPNGVRWVLVHETPIQASSGPSKRGDGY